MNGLLFITHETERDGYLQGVEIALQGGCRMVQLRMKDAAPAEVEATGKEALRLCRRYGAQLFIDDHVEVCSRLGAAGVHLGKNDMPPSQARLLLGKGYLVGGTANTFEDILRLQAEGVDYIGLGPFRFTTTKKNLSPVLGLEGYRRITAQCRAAGVGLPVIAIGGITRADIPALLDAGVAGIALSSAILNADSPVDETRFITDEILFHQKNAAPCK
jgi:thiamine-phosphate pyrophosphorylase